MWIYNVQFTSVESSLIPAKCSVTSVWSVPEWGAPLRLWKVSEVLRLAAYGATHSVGRLTPCGLISKLSYRCQHSRKEDLRYDENSCNLTKTINLISDRFTSVESSLIPAKCSVTSVWSVPEWGAPLRLWKVSEVLRLAAYGADHRVGQLATCGLISRLSYWCQHSRKKHI